MKHVFLSIVTAAMVAATPLFAQQGDSDAQEEQDQVELKSGVRFVNCSPTNTPLPTPLFCKIGKGYKQIRINSRVPSPRVKPVNGVINIYDEDPTPATDADDAKGGKGGKAKGGKAKGGKAKGDAEEIQPAITLKVPEDKRSGKVLCIMRPTSLDKKPYNVMPIFIAEKDFPKNGVYIINLTDTPLEIKVSTAEDGSYDGVKPEVINPSKDGKSISAENTWKSPSGKGATVSFILNAKDAKGKIKRIKASRFTVSDRQSQINIVVKDKESDRYTLQSIQLTDKDEDNKKKNKQ